MNTIVIALLAIIGVFLIVQNALVFHAQIKHHSTSSWIPLLGGIFLSLSLAQMPYDFEWYVIVLPFFIDMGSVPGIAYTVYYWVFIYPKKKKEGKSGSLGED